MWNKDCINVFISVRLVAESLMKTKLSSWTFCFPTRPQGGAVCDDSEGS